MGSDALGHLARLCGVQRDYIDVAGQLRRAAPEVVLEVLAMLGEPVDRAGAVPDALRHRRQAMWAQVIEPVCVAWAGQGEVTLRVPARLASSRWRGWIDLEDGRRREWTGRVHDLPTRRERRIEGVCYQAKRLTLPGPLPAGYHRLGVELAGAVHEALLLAAPRRTFDVVQAERLRGWGVFLPLYALTTAQGLGAGDVADLEKLIGWVAGLGGDVVASLPLLATAWELGNDMSPYSPTSRLFWNEFYLDLPRIPEFARCERARRLMGDPRTQHRIEQLRQASEVDYAGVMALKRRVLELLAQTFWAGREGQDDLAAFLRGHGQAERFARFRAVGERQGHPWPQWPSRQRGGRLRPGDYDEGTYRYHLYVQWQIERQVGHLADRAREAGVVWYLDLPVGVSRTSYDLWAEPEAFVTQASVGAPPDTFFTRGQNWDLPPMHPRRLRETGYRYFIESLRSHLRFARLLRIDHVMGLHRLFWVPTGRQATEGVYVRYPSEEMFAILCIETHRHRASVIGENLGTVPWMVNHLMARHGVPGMYVGMAEARSHKPPRTLRPVPRRCAASLGTHDTPMFAAWWQGLDIASRQEQGLLDQAGAARERTRRRRLRQALAAHLRHAGLLPPGRATAPRVLRAWLAWLASSPAQIVLASLEDLWGETQPQNTPGHSGAVPNWHRKARLPFDQFTRLPAVRETLKLINRRRQRGATLPDSESPPP